MDTISPFVTLVDIHGDPVPDCERHTPTCPPDPEDPADWPAWTDNFSWETTELPVAYDDEAAALGALEDLPWPDDAPDADPRIAFAGIAPPADRAPPASISGGAPDAYVPTDEDLADYAAWCAEVEARDAIRRADDARNPIFGYE